MQKDGLGIFRNNKIPYLKNIDNPYQKDLERIATSFFVSNFPETLDAKGLWNACAMYGQIVDAFIANKCSKRGLIDLLIRSRYYTWMNKEGTKLSKLDRFLISEGISEDIPDIRVTAIDCMWSDHTLILLHAMKLDFGPNRILKSHEKLRCLKTTIKQWHSNTRNNDRTLKQVALSDIKDLEKKIDDGSVSSLDHDKRIKVLQDIDKLYKLETLDLIQKAHIKWASREMIIPNYFMGD
ncbi:RNA-directed DNA polymerase, eukaryota, reverse transcriptase zinc-binding domain protein [Tanacetum coccineum]